MNIQTIIKNRRLELDLTMKDVAKALGVSEATVSRYESGEIQNMGIDKIEKLAKVFPWLSYGLGRLSQFYNSIHFDA